MSESQRVADLELALRDIALLLGAEDTGIPRRVLERCKHIVSIPGEHSLNVAVAGSIVLYDRIAREGVGRGE